MQINGTEFSEEELRILRLWTGIIKCHSQLCELGQIPKSMSHPKNIPGFMTFILTPLCKRFVTDRDVFEVVSSPSVLETLGIKPL